MSMKLYSTLCCRLENPENLLKYKEELGEFGVEKKNDYVNTNISVSSDYELTKEKVENVLIGDITTHNHDSSYIKDAPKDSRYYGRQEGT